MKCSLLYSLLIITTCGGQIKAVGESLFEKQRGNPEHFEKFTKTGECPGCDLRGFDIAGAVKNLFRGVSRNRQFPVNLAGANLEGADFSKGHFEGADLTGANCSRGNFEGAHLSNANCADANFEGANLNKAHLFDTNCSGANFEDANLEQAVLTFARITLNTSFKRASLAGAEMEILRIPPQDLKTFESLNDFFGCEDCKK